MKRCAIFLAASVFLVLCAWPLPAAAKEKTKAQQRAEIRKMERETLARLYKAQPGAKAAVERAAGYAVFDNFGTHILVISSARGQGVAVDNRTKKATYMKMYSGGVGLGAGVKDYRVVFVFSTRKAFDDFMKHGWDAEAQADAAAIAGRQGEDHSGATSVAPGVSVYQITETGLALQATLHGTKYVKDKDLN
jgi:lipid-binding SYLF domain-containing protein